ncbi:hypothetical protein [Polyangium aurulentum]|uniref:hypothetical protein n=1 Tax=Polyangium aurulentum TaxID=2567896 RepID=UPI0010AE2483|nr:hypothetical protein [Polyangium aurulentum]UQA57800.1 hypothetical protein E8A73_042070 [Polyangium aurulentum]
MPDARSSRRFLSRARIASALFVLLAGCSGGNQGAQSATQTAANADSAENASGETGAGAPAQDAAPAAPAAFLKDAPALSLLSDRLTLRMPAGARVAARPHSIMAADQPNEQETRAILDAGDERLVVMTYEAFAKISKDKDPESAVRAAMNKDFDAPKPTLAPLPLADGNLKAWVVYPATVDKNREAILVLAAYVLHPDGFVQTLSFYVNPASAKGEGCSGQIRAANASAMPKAPGELPGCTALARAIASTLAAGPRRLDMAAGERKIQGQYNDDTFLATVPAGTNVTTQKGPDFTVHRVLFPADLGAPQQTLGIYVGGHPSFQFNQVEAQVKPTQRPGRALGQAVVWQVWPVSPERVMAEAMVAHPKTKGTKVHLFAGAGNEKDLAPLLDMAASLRLP